jgi:hypothetical protein
MGWCSKHCPPDGDNSTVVAVTVVAMVAVVVLIAPAVIAFIDGAMVAALASVFGALAVSVVFAVWFVRQQPRSWMWEPAARKPRLEALPVGERVAIATGEVRRKAIGAPRRVVATVVSRTDEPSVGLRP